MMRLRNTATLLYSAYSTFLKQAKVNIMVRKIFNPDFFKIKLVYDTVRALEPEPSEPELPYFAAPTPSKLCGSGSAKYTVILYIF
jgi:hypothetical protein